MRFDTKRSSNPAVIDVRPTASRIIGSAVGAALGALLLTLLAVWPAALAASPHRLAAPLTDDVGVLTGQTDAVQARLDELQRATGSQLWVWYTSTLDGADASDFATQTARESGLGPTDLLLVIALDDRAYGWWKGDAVKLADSDFDGVLSSELEPALRAGDEPGAIVATAAGLEKVMTSAPATEPPGASTPGPIIVTSPPVEPSPGTSQPGSPFGVVGPLVLIAALVGGGWWLITRGRRPSRGPVAVADPSDPNADLAALQLRDLDELANRTLVETDDAVRDSDQELGFAQAQFGEEAAEPFVAAIAAARGDLKRAFTIRQQLDDSTPEDDATRRTMLTDVVVAARTARGRLRDELKHFDELRALEREAPRILAGLPAAADALEARLPAAGATLAGLGDYADRDWQSVAGNVDNARARIAAVREAVTKGQAAAAAGDAGIAAHSARLGEDGIAQATGYLDAIDRLAAELADARSTVDAALATEEADLARIRDAAAKATDVDARARLAEAGALLVSARTALAPPKPDVTGAHEMIRKADAITDAIEGDIRSAEEQERREAARLDAGLRTAQVAVTRASDYIAGQRGGIGTEARTRLAEASRHLEAALAAAATDRDTAIAEADQASRLAAEAERLARSDYGRWNDPFGGGLGGGGGRNAGADVTGAIIGGIIGGLLSGGGHRGGWGGGGGFGGFGGGGGGFGGFGGSGGGGSSGGGGIGGGGSSGQGRW